MKSAERPPIEAVIAISPDGSHSKDSGSYGQVPSRFSGVPPATSTTYNLADLVRSGADTNAILRPSGENESEPSLPFALVSRRGVPPVSSPSGTAATITTLEDNDLVYRTSPSDAYNSEVFAKALVAKGVTELGLTYVNNDYGKGLADNFSAAYTAAGGTITANVAHEEGKAEYRAELGQIAASGTQNLLVLAYANGSGKTVLQQAVESGDFTAYFGADGMVDNVLLEGFPAGALDGMIAMRPSEPTGAGPDAFAAAAAAGGLTTGSTFQQQSYDALFLIALALEKNKGAKEGLAQALRDVANAPGEVVLPGEWSKAKELIAAGTDIDYQGASGPIEFDAAGDVAGSVVEMKVENGAFVEVGPLT